MMNGDVAMCWVNDESAGVLSDRFIPALRTAPEVDGIASDDNLNLETAKQLTADGVTTTECTFTRPIAATDPTTDRGVVGAYLIWAVGSVNTETPSYHTAKGFDNNPYNSNRINFFEGGESRQRSRRDLTETMTYDESTFQ